MSRESRVQSSPGPIFFFVYFIKKNKDSKDSKDSEDSQDSQDPYFRFLVARNFDLAFLEPPRLLSTAAVCIGHKSGPAEFMSSTQPKISAK